MPLLRRASLDYEDFPRKRRALTSPQATWDCPVLKGGCGKYNDKDLKYFRKQFFPEVVPYIIDFFAAYKNDAVKVRMFHVFRLKLSRERIPE